MYIVWHSIKTWTILHANCKSLCKFQSTCCDSTEGQIEIPDVTKEDKEGGITVQDEEDDSAIDLDDQEEDKGQEPTSWKQLDIKSMKVSELRAELDARNINSKGLKAQLVARLQEAAQKEQEKQNETKLDNAPSETKDKDEGGKQLETETVVEEVVEETKEGNERMDTSDGEQLKDEGTKEQPEVMEVDSKNKVVDANHKKDEDAVFVKPAPAMDEKQKQALLAAYKLPGTSY